jgi:threonyl-tRNA synthetase
VPELNCLQRKHKISAYYGTAFEKKGWIRRIRTAWRKQRNATNIIKLAVELELVTYGTQQSRACRSSLVPKGAAGRADPRTLRRDEEAAPRISLTKRLYANASYYKNSGHWDHYREGHVIKSDTPGHRAMKMPRSSRWAHDCPFC